MVGARVLVTRVLAAGAGATMLTVGLSACSITEPQFAVGDCVRVDDDAINDDIEAAECDGAQGTFDETQRIYRVDSLIEGTEGTCPMGRGFFPVQFTHEPDDVIYCLVQEDGTGQAAPSTPADASPTVEATPESLIDPATLAAAEAAVETITSYSWTTLVEDKAAHEAVSTPAQWERAEQLWDLIETNAPATRTEVQARVLESAVISGSEQEGRWRLLMFVDRETTNVNSKKPIVYKDTVVVVVVPGAESSGAGEWLIDEILTGPDAANTPTDGPASAAAQLVADLSTYSTDDLDADGTVSRWLDGITAQSTEDYARELETQADTLADLLRAGQAARFELIAAGLVRDTDGQATALVAGNRISILDGEEQEPLPVRMVVELVEQNGQWLIDDTMAVSG